MESAKIKIFYPFDLVIILLLKVKKKYFSSMLLEASIHSRCDTCTFSMLEENTFLSPCLVKLFDFVYRSAQSAKARNITEDLSSSD